MITFLKVNYNYVYIGDKNKKDDVVWKYINLNIYISMLIL